MIGLNRLVQFLVLFPIGGISYYFIEILWRGYSHISMFILGGLCFVTIGLVREHYFTPEIQILKQLAVSCFIITVLEFIFGFILNVKFGLDIWDYSGLKFHLMGQISLASSIVWFFLSLPAIIFYDYIRYWLFGEKKPSYKFI